MDKRKRNLASIGLLTIVAAGIFFWGLFWMLGTPVFRGGTDFSLLLRDGGGLKRSDRVQLQGVQVGTVRSIQLHPQGGVVVGLRLDQENLALPTDTRATITGDVFGAHVVDLIPGTSGVSISPGDTLRGAASPQFTQIATDLSTRVESVLINADRLLSPAAVADVHADKWSGGPVAHLVSMGSTSVVMDAAIADLRRQGSADGADRHRGRFHTRQDPSLGDFLDSIPIGDR